MAPIDLIHLQITLEYALDEAGRLVPFLARESKGCILFTAMRVDSRRTAASGCRRNYASS